MIQQVQRQSKNPNVMKKPRETDAEILDFFLHRFKCWPCQFPKGACPDKSTCEGFHHEGERRRNPFYGSSLLYSEEPCPKIKTRGKWLKPSNCDNGDNCPFSHTMLEQMYHPNIFKTSLCTNFASNIGDQCQWGYFCTHAHGQKEIRNPGKKNNTKIQSMSDGNNFDEANMCSLEALKDVPLINTRNYTFEKPNSLYSSGNGSSPRSYTTPSYQTAMITPNDMLTPNSKYSPLPPSGPPSAQALNPPHLSLPTASRYHRPPISTHSKTPNNTTENSTYFCASRTFPNHLNDEKKQPQHYSWGITLRNSGNNNNNNNNNNMSNPQFTPPPPTLNNKSYDSYHGNSSPSQSYIGQTFTPSGSATNSTPPLKSKQQILQTATSTSNQAVDNQFQRDTSLVDDISKYGVPHVQTIDMESTETTALKNNLNNVSNTKIAESLHYNDSLGQQQQQQSLQTSISNDGKSNSVNNSSNPLNTKEANADVSYYLFGDESLLKSNPATLINIAKDQQNEEIIQLQEQINELKKNLKLEKEKNQILLDTLHNGNHNVENEIEKMQEIKWFVQFMTCSSCHSQKQLEDNFLMPCGHLICGKCVPQKDQCCPICMHVINQNVQKINL